MAHCHFKAKKKLVIYVWFIFKRFFFLKFTLNVFHLTEAFLRVAVAGPMASLDPIPQASFMATSNRFPLQDK